MDKCFNIHFNLILNQIRIFKLCGFFFFTLLKNVSYYFSRVGMCLYGSTYILPKFILSTVLYMLLAGNEHVLSLAIQ